jgi:hypothetical protein
MVGEEVAGNADVGIPKVEIGLQKGHEEPRHLRIRVREPELVALLGSLS